jgi:hypothetical protein
MLIIDILSSDIYTVRYMLSLSKLRSRNFEGRDIALLLSRTGNL